MKELVATAHNLFYTRGEDGRFEPSIELILVTSEPEYRVKITDGNVRLRQTRRNESQRVVCSPGALGLLVKSAIEAMEEIKQQSGLARAADTGEQPAPRDVSESEASE